MSQRTLSHLLWRLCAFVVALALIVPSVPPALPARAAGDLTDLIKAYEASLGKSAQAQQEAAMALFQRYGEYKKLVASGGQVAPATARALDERLVDMTQQVWRDVSVRHGSGLSHIVPVGTLGDRMNNPAYIPGKSDKDFIPRGSKAAEAARDFTEAFERKFGIPASNVDVNALDPTTISKWPDRVLAASNFEKYNTKGGIAWLEREMYNAKPDLWRFDSMTGKMEQVKFDRMVSTPPSGLKPEHAAGFLSDNLKFRQHLAEEFAGDPRALSLKQAKYDQRNVTAFVLSGGEFTDAEKQMLACTDLMRAGRMDRAAAKYGALIGEADPQKALLAYREAMEALTERMTREVVERHVALMASGKLTQAAADELAAAVVNMPQYRGLVEKVVSEKLGKAEWNEINKLANAFGERVSAARFGVEYFNEQAMKHFNKPYDQLSDAQKSILHGAEEAAEGLSAGKIIGHTLNAALSAYSVYSSYQAGKKEGTATAVGYAAGRTFIELLQLGYPPAQVAELVGLVAAGLINWGAEGYKNSVLDALYEAYKAKPSDTTLRDLLDTQAFLGYYAGGIREFAKSLRMEDEGLTDDQIRQKLSEYLTGRLAADKMQARLEEFASWADREGVPLQAGGDWTSAITDNYYLKTKDPAAYYARLANLLKAYDDWADRLRADGILFTAETIKHILWLTYRGTPEDLQKFLEELYASSNTPCSLEVGSGQLGRIISARDTVISQTVPSRGGAMARPQVLVTSSGSFRKPEDPRASCDPSKFFGPFEVAGSGQISATITGEPPVPQEWSQYNNNTGLAVTFEPKVGGGYRGAGNLLILAGQVTDNHPAGQAQWTGPGRLRVTIDAPSGAGPFHGGCFDQSYSAKVEVVAFTPDRPAVPDDRILPGNQIITGPGGETVIQLPDCSKLLVRPNSTLTFTSPAPGIVQVHVQRGGFRLQRPPRGGHGLWIKMGDATAKPVGTELEVLVTDEGETITVIDGAVAVTPDGGGEEVLVEAGQRGKWPGGEVVPYDASDDLTKDAPVAGGLPLSQIPTDDGVREPYGVKAADFIDNGVPAGWVWQDPGSDVTLETPEAGALRLTVPDGNDLWDTRSESPRLLHKVTGDFDLEAEARLDCAGTDMSTLEFLLYSPGSAAGDLAGQMRADSPAANYLIMGGGWFRGSGQNKLLRLNKRWQDGVDAPAEGPVRLRLTRRGDLWKTYWSRDGKNWVLSWRDELSAPDTVWVGWLAKRMAYDGLKDEPARVTLRDVRLTTGARGELAAEPWDVVSPDGIATFEGERTLRLVLDGSRVGGVSVQSSEPLVGDFDVVARFDGVPARKLGESRYVALAMHSGDDQQHAVALLLENDSVQETLVTNLARDGGWINEKRQPPYDTTRLRIVRRGDLVSTYRWSDCTWAALSGYEAAVEGPLYLSVGIGNDWHDAPTPSPVEARWTIEQVSADESPFGADWAPETCSVMTPSTLPAGAQVPANLTSQWLNAPFPLGRLFFGPDGTAYAFSSDKEKQVLLEMAADGTARPFARSDLLSAINLKSGAWVDGDALVAADFWPESGNSHGGLYRLSPSGTFAQWTLSADYGGMSDVIAAPQGGWYFSDFERDNVWHLPGEGQPEQPVITSGDIPPGLAKLAVDPTDGTLYALNWKGEGSPFGGAPGIYRIAGGQAELLIEHPEGTAYNSIAFNSGTAFPYGLYASDPASGSIVHIAPDGRATPVVTGLTNPDALGFSPATGALWVICDGKNVLVAYDEAAAPPTRTVAVEEAAPLEEVSEGASELGEVLAPVAPGFTPEPPAPAAGVAPTATPRNGAASSGAGRAGGAVNLSGGPSPTPAGARVVASPVSQRGPTPAVESPPVAAVGAGFAGTWETDYGTMILQVLGDRVIGLYNYKDGQLAGTLSPDGRTLSGTWSQSPTHAPPTDAGRFVFTLNDSGQGFEGSWGYGERSDKGNWHGTRVSQ